jgi:hypothetical protein
VRELLRALYDAMSDKEGLSRGEIVGRFVSALPPALADRLHVIPGANGLRNLFGLLGSPPDIQPRRFEGETRYRIDRGAAGPSPPSEMQLNFSVPVMVNGQTRARVPTGELGLSVLPGAVILLDGERYVVERIITDNRGGAQSVIAQPIPSRPPDSMLPVLTYRFPEPTPAASEGSSPSPSASWIALHEKDNHTIHLTLYAASFERATVGSLTYAADLPPLDKANVSRQPLRFGSEDWQTVPRTLQPVWRLRFAGALPEGTPAARAELLAFTLSVAIQDVARSLFPRWSHRLFAVSPKASALIARTRGPNGRPSPPFAGPDAFLSYVYPLLVPADKEPADSRDIDIYLLEDSDFDLGVVRALHNDEKGFFGELHEYLGWTLRQDGHSRFHRFGADAPYTALDYEWTFGLLHHVSRA